MSTIARIKGLKDDEGGFTLVELLIVIIVIGILASIVIFAVGNTKGDADAAKTSADNKICRTANAAAQAKYGTGYTLTNVNEFLSASNAGACPVAAP